MMRLWDPLGGPSTRLLFAGYGTAVLLFGLKTYASVPAELLTSPGAWALHGFCLVAAALIAFGARPILLVAAGLFALRCVVANHRPEEPLLWFPAAEWPLFVVLPFCGLLGTDAGVRNGFRLSAVAALGFAGLHKLNRDYFDPSVTCNRLSARLSEWWALPTGLHEWVGPPVVIAFELGAPLLLLAMPRVGLVFALAVLLHFTGIGATALSTVIAVACLAFLEDDDVTAVRQRGWPVLLASIPMVFGSWALYRGPWSWPQYGITHGIFGVLLALAVWRLIEAGPGRPVNPFRGPRPALVVLAVLWLLDGLAPYSGLKFQYSFAMLSNLRVDDDRHNSLLFPRSLRFTTHDPYVHVLQARYFDARGRPLSGGVVSRGLWAPHELVRQRANAASVDETLTFRGTYQGRAVSEADLDALPPAPLFQGHLSQGAPQPCVH